MKTVIITGGRDYDDFAMVEDVLNFINPEKVIQGGAKGADKLAADWALRNDKTLMTYEANWDDYGRSAGPRRNREMLNSNNSAIVIAFKGGIGTADCVAAAIERNMIVLQVR